MSVIIGGLETMEQRKTRIGHYKVYNELNPRARLKSGADIRHPENPSRGAPRFSPYRPTCPAPFTETPKRHCGQPLWRLSYPAVQTPTSPEGIAQVSILKYTGQVTSGLMARDDLTIEEPLEISVKFRRGSNLVKKPLSITMRTPGSDRGLAVGFLFTEGILHEISMLSSVDQEAENSVVVTLNEEVNLQRLERHFYTTSSCGVCGKTSLEALRINREIYLNSSSPKVSPQLLVTLPEILARYQSEFSRTGGIHASAIFDGRGHLCAISEDVGRHNALDRLIGNELLAGRSDFSDLVLLVSGRASFELVQKSVMAGIPIMAAVGAPSSLAVDLAQRYGMTLVGFLRDNRFNLYSGAARVVASDTVLGSRL